MKTIIFDINGINTMLSECVNLLDKHWAVDNGFKISSNEDGISFAMLQYPENASDDDGVVVEQLDYEFVGDVKQFTWLLARQLNATIHAQNEWHGLLQSYNDHGVDAIAKVQRKIRARESMEQAILAGVKGAFNQEPEPPKVEKTDLFSKLKASLTGKQS